MKLPQEIIQSKRDADYLSSSEIKTFVSGITDGSVTDAQIAAMAMAIYFNGMTRDEAVDLTLAMRDSGDVLDWKFLDGPVVDKHSTGGVGDNVSLMLAPALAACGAFVPMISGRGLGHTGGTLDKFESIPGYNVQPTNELFGAVTQDAGCAIIGQTGDLAPADKRFYGIRDVTATVESVALITASILSKKLAAGLHNLVLDVKVGSGAFMQDLDSARELANSLVEVANGAGLKTSALITDMDRPLANCAGNAVEMKSAVELLNGRHIDQRLHRVCVELGGELLLGSGLATSYDDGCLQMRQSFESGRAAECFGKMVHGLGGPSDFIERYYEYLKLAPIAYPILPQEGEEKFAGRLGFDTRQIGMAVVELGGGRTNPSDTIDHSVGILDIAGFDWDGVSPLCVILANSEADAKRAEKRIRGSLQVTETENDPILERVRIQ